jgi:hypothetical protein
MSNCLMCGGSGRRLVPCPDGRLGCAVAHFGPCDHDPRSPLEKRVDDLERRLKLLENASSRIGIDAPRHIPRRKPPPR